jgi:hypothetical protein
VAEVAFNEALHEYRVGGRLVPSVTQVLGILQDFGGVNADVLARAAEFGTHVHQACALANAGTIDEAALDPSLAPYLAQWRRFLSESGAEILASELRVFHRGLRYAGTLDALALWKGQRCIIDIKTGQMPRTVGAQTEAYRMAYQSQECGEVPRRRYCVQLTEDAYKVHALTDPADWSLFQSCLNIWRFRND